MQLLEPECVTLCFHMHQGGRAPSPDSVELRLSRLLEERVASLEGVQVRVRVFGKVGGLNDNANSESGL